MINIKYPKGQCLKVTYCIDGIPKYIVCREQNNYGKFTLYLVNDDGSVKKIKSNESPFFDEIDK